MKLFGNGGRRNISQKTAKPAKRFRALKIGVGAIVSVVLIAILVYALVVKKPPTNPATMNTLPPNPEQTPTDSTEDEIPHSDPLRRDDTWVFLIAGIDDGLKSDEGDINTDTIIVATLDLVRGDLNVVNIPRDTLVNVSWDIKKVNSMLFERDTNERKLDAFLDGIRGLLGFSVDYYALIELSAFSRLVDAINGVDFDVPVDMHYWDPTQDLTINFDKGLQHLNGEEAMKVMRFRDYPNADLGRIDTQQNFLKTVAKQLLTPGSIFKIREFVDILNDCVETNMRGGDMIWFIEQLAGMSMENINFGTMPFDGYYVFGISYVTIKTDEWVTMINERLNPFEKEVSKDTLNLLTIENGALYATSGVIEGGVESFRVAVNNGIRPG